MNTHTSTSSEALYRVVEAEGELDILTAPSFGARLRGDEDDEGDGGPARWRLIADLSRVSFMDSSPLYELCAVGHRNDLRGGWTRVVYAHAGIALLFRAADLARTFPRYASVDDARQDRRSSAHE
ncbi:STAS domain-containing protein [Streptomyces polyrhachis]|uniref:STAS domain-containing protein n=1 Tax=Streptomyces polyrhachis TaxID=1282885 RepID=A0ABW2GDZ1_9ACTN